MAEKVKKEKSKARKIFEWIFVSIFGAAAVFMMVATVDGMIHKKEHYNQTIRFGVGTFTVETDSMEPEIMTGDMIITKAEDVSKFATRLEKGEVIDVTFFNIGIDDTGITINDPALTHETDPVYYPMTHRLREVHVRDGVEYGSGKYVFVVSGINEKSPKWSPDQYQTFTEKEYLGTVKVTNSFAGHTMKFISSPFGLIILLLIPAIYLITVSSIDIFKTVKEEEAKENSVKLEGEHLSNLSDKERQRLKDELLEEMIKAKKEGKKDE